MAHEIDRRELLTAIGGGAALVPAASGYWGLAAARPPGAASRTAMTGATTLTDLARALADPPVEARPGVYWYWMGGSVTKAGITADLTAMKDAGISTAVMFSIGKSGKTPLVVPPANALTDTWWAMVEHAAAEADRIGMTLAMNMCDGWATASGPWITPDLSMQHLIWGEVRVDGGRTTDILLPRGPVKRDYHRDVAVLAVPWPAAWDETSVTRRATAKVSGAPVDAARLLDPDHDGATIETDTAVTITMTFDRPFTLRSVTIRTPKSPTGYAPGVNRAANSLWVEASDDGATFRPVGRLDYPDHGWQTDLTTLTHAVPETRARIFRLVHRPEGPFTYAEDSDFGQDTTLRLSSVVLSAAPQVHHLPVKSGAAWGRSRRMDAADLPAAACVPAIAIVDVAAAMDQDGRLRWQAPRGRWRILRIGMTTTGKTNAAAGLGEGLECDRFNPVAAKLQFDSWFGRTLDRIGPRAGRILKTVHVDSWEAGTQNWGPTLAAGFRERRGYDPLRWIAAMAGVPVDSADMTERFLFDVRRTVADLTGAHFYAVVRDAAHARGCTFSGEPPSPTFLADGLDYARDVDMPMGEFWVDTPRNDKPNDIRDAVSGAAIYGKRVVGAESFTQGRMTWREHPYVWKALGDHVFCEGVNRLMLHVWSQQPWPDRAPGMTLNGIGSHFAAQQSWWTPGRAWFDYLIRCQTLLQQGVRAADIACFIGEDIPTRALLPGRVHPELPAGHAYDSINRDALLRLARVEDGTIVLPGGARYRMLLLPGDARMTPELTAKVAELVRAGATVHGRRPDASPSLTGGSAADAAVRRSAAGWSTPGDLGPLLARIGLTPAVMIMGAGAAGIEWVHRRGPGWEMLFLSNQRDAAADIVVGLRGKGLAPEAWYPDCGAIVPLGRWVAQDGRIDVPLTLDPRGSLFLLFAPARDARPVVAVTPTTDAPRFVRQAGGVAAVVRTSGRWTARRGDASSPIAVTLPPAQVVPGPWTVRFAEHIATPKTIRLYRLASWSDHPDPDIRFYSGVAVYTTRIVLPTTGPGDRLLIDLGDVASLATVLIDGREIATAWKPPFVVALPDGIGRRVRLEIRVANTWRNRLIGDHGKPPAERQSFVVPMLRKGQEWLPGAAGETPDPAGLLGPVRILTERTVLL
ncbi:glycosyl hydrolase [Sphingomonas montana]|uniref:glycosyl hydrolase n=1 Tax=Sphingomonas montana TaxID=1843236 RepID=UPI0013EB268D|nr:glycosyl hydrolase [Sphingomonas montana]